ncbi:MAG TPA: carbohydrate ABC transporter permease [Acidimicrobiales bacterium]|nr:carbohydrate ABC transporter permease [Acidimicrobiales bacterium]
MATTLTPAGARAARRRRWARVGLYALVVGFTLMAAFPFLWGLITAFKAHQDLYNRNNNPFIFNRPPTLEHVRLLFENTAFDVFVNNTVVVAVVVVLITLAASVPAAYSLARLSLRWGGALGIAIFFVYLIPPSLLFISLSRVVSQLGLQDSRWALVVVYPTITIPVSVWLLMGFFKSIPRDMEEQAMVDGYSRLGAFVRTVLPLSLPGIVAVVVFTATLSASEFIYALAFVSQTSQKTVSVGVPTELVRGDVFFWQSLQAATLLVAIPIALVFNAFLKRFVAGFTMGAVKG